MRNLVKRIGVGYKIIKRLKTISKIKYLEKRGVVQIYPNRLECFCDNQSRTATEDTPKLLCDPPTTRTS